MLRCSPALVVLAACHTNGAKPVPGVDALRGTIVLLGEVHGTAEAPAFVGAVAEQLATAGPLVIGLEIPWPEQPRIDTFLASRGTAADHATLVAGPFWQRSYQDGRSSVAMHRLLERLRVARIPVLAFDIEDGASAAHREERMAQRLLAARGRGRIVVLTGNVHARTAVGAPWDPAFEPMGHRLKRAVQLDALDMAHEGGHAWICLTPVAEECGPHELRGMDHGVARSVTRHRAPTPEGYDGAFHLGGPATSSPPAIRPE